MKNKLFMLFVMMMLFFASSENAYGITGATSQKLANGAGVAVKIGIIVLVTLLVLLTAVFAYGLIRNWLKTRRKKNKSDE